MASEVVGKFLMILVAIGLFASLFFLMIPNINTVFVSDSLASCVAYIHKDSIVIEHQGGNTLEIYEVTNNDEIAKSGTNFEIGDKISIPANLSNDNSLYLFDFPDGNKRMVAYFYFDGFGWNPQTPFTTIQEAIDNADPYDIITVPSGIYYECIIIWKPLTLVTEDAIIDGNNTCVPVTIEANNVVVDGFIIKNGYFNGINIHFANNFCIRNCQIESIFVYSVSLSNAHNGSIENCNINGSMNPLNILSSNDNLIDGNTICNSSNQGIIIWGNSCRNRVTSNSIFDNLGYGLNIQSGYDNIIVSNEFWNNGGDNAWDETMNEFNGNGFDDFISNPYAIEVGNSDSNAYKV